MHRIEKKKKKKDIIIGSSGCGCSGTCSRLWWCGLRQWKWLRIWIWWRRSLESSSLTLEIWDSYTLSDCSPFWNQLNNEQMQTYNCQISQIFLFLWTFFNALKTFPFTQYRSRERGELHFRESPILEIYRGGKPPDHPRSSCLRNSALAPAARTVHVRQLNHCIRYFQMLRKTLPQSIEV